MHSVAHLLEKFHAEPGIHLFKNCIEKWEFDYENIQDDINEDEELKDEIPLALYIKLQSYIKNDCKTAMPSDHDFFSCSSNKNELAQITEDSFIKNDIEDKEESIEYSQLDGYVSSSNTDDTEGDSVSDDDTEDINTWNNVLMYLKKQNNLMFDNNIYERCVNHYMDNEFTIDQYMECESNDYEDCELHDIFPNLIHEQKIKLWKCLTNAINHTTSYMKIHSYLISDQHLTPQLLTKKQCHNNNTQLQSINIPINQHNDNKTIAISPKPSNICIYADDMKGDQYNKIDTIISQCESLINASSINTDNNDAGQALRRFCSIYGLNKVMLMIDLKMRQTCMAFYQPTYNKMMDHLSVLATGLDTVHTQFIKSNFISKTHNNLYWNNNYKGLNVTGTPRFLGHSSLSNIIADCRRPVANISNPTHTDDNDDDDDDNLDYHQDLHIQRPSLLNFGARETQKYMIAFIVGTTRFLLKDFADINCDVALDLKIPSNMKYKSPKASTHIKDLRNQIDSIMFKFMPPFQNNLVKGTFRKNIEKHKMAIWSVDMSLSSTKERFPDGHTQQPKYMAINMDLKEYENLYDDVELYHLMRMKRYFMEQAINDRNRNNEVRRIGISVHKMNQSVKIYCHFEGIAVRILPMDICGWLPHLFLNRENELSWIDIQPYLKNVLNDNKRLHSQQWMKSNQSSVWKKMDNWNQLDKEFAAYHLKLSQKVSHMNGMIPYSDIFKLHLT